MQLFRIRCHKSNLLHLSAAKSISLSSKLPACSTFEIHKMPSADGATVEYPVYDVTFGMGSCLHHGVFVLINDDAGPLYDVRGSVSSNGGLTFAVHEETLQKFNNKVFKGHIRAVDLMRLEGICRDVPTPDTQYPPGSMTGAINPPCRCREWIVRVWNAVSHSNILIE